jgi:hypothetical protein
LPERAAIGFERSPLGSATGTVGTATTEGGSSPASTREEIVRFGTGWPVPLATKLYRGPGWVFAPLPGRPISRIIIVVAADATLTSLWGLTHTESSA